MHAVGQQRGSNARSWRPVCPGSYTCLPQYCPLATPAYRNTALSYGRPNAGYVYFDEPDKPGDKPSGQFKPSDHKFKPNGDKIWRHFAYQFDEVEDELRLFLDGTMVFSMPFGAAVSAVDCVGQGKRWTLGHSHPG